MYCPFCIKQNNNSSKFCSSCGKPLDAQNGEHQLPIGTMLENRYYVGAVIRQGGFGITYVGCDTRLEKKIAVKEYYPSGLVTRMSGFSQDITITAGENSPLYEKEKQRFLTEANILARFSGEKYIVNVTDVFPEHNTAYIIMEYVDGADLDNYLNSHSKMSFDDAYELIKPLMETLSRIHEHGLIHRDISPSNIKILSDQTPVLLDFGAAREFSADKDRSLSVILKPGYAPPEQYQSHGEQGPWTDVYAICATIYKMITGISPQNAVDRLVSDKLQKPSELNADISIDKENALIHGLELIPDKRIQSMRQLQGLFDQADHSALLNDKQDYDKTVILPASIAGSAVIPPVPGTSKRQINLKKIIILGIFAIISVSGALLFRNIKNQDSINNNTYDETDDETPVIHEENTETVNTSDDEGLSLTGTLITGSEVILIGDTTNIKYVSGGMEYSSVDGIRYEYDDNISVEFDEDTQQTLIVGKYEGTAHIRGIKGKEYGETQIIVAEEDTSSDVSVDCDTDQIEIISDLPDGVSINVSLTGKLPERITANVYNSKGLDLNIDGGFSGDVLTLNIRDVASRYDDGTVTVLFSDADDPSHVIGKAIIPVHIYF